MSAQVVALKVTNNALTVEPTTDVMVVRFGTGLAFPGAVTTSAAQTLKGNDTNTEAPTADLSPYATKALLGLGTAADHDASDFDSDGSAATVQTNLTAETARAEAAEAGLASTSAVTAEAAARVSGDATNATAITTEATRAETAEATKFDTVGPSLAKSGTDIFASQGSQFGPGLDRWHWALAQTATRPAKIMFVGDSEIEFIGAFNGVTTRLATRFAPPNRIPGQFSGFSALAGLFGFLNATWFSNKLTVTVNATGGTWSMTVGNQTATGLAWNITTANLQTALLALSSVGAGNATVSGSAGSYSIAFADSLNCPTCTVSSTGLTGGTHTASIAPAGATQVANRGFSGYGLQMADGTKWRSISSTWDQVQVRWLAGGTGSTIDIAIDGTTVVSGLDTSAANSWTSSFQTYMPHTVTITAHGTPFVDYGYFYVSNQSSGIQSWMVGHSGDTAHNAAANWSDLGTSIAALNPDLVVIEFGINDSGNSAATFQADLETLITTVTASGASVMGWLANELVSKTGFTNKFLPVWQALSLEHGFPFVNAGEHIPSLVAGDSLGYTIDGVHYTSLGADIVSRGVANVVMANERNTVPYLPADGSSPGSLAEWRATGLGGTYSAKITNTVFGQEFLSFDSVPPSANGPTLTVGPYLLVTGLTGSVAASADTQFILDSVPGTWRVANALRLNGLTGAGTVQYRLAGSLASGAPTSGTFATGDLVWTADGHVWICSAGGSPGTWTDVNSTIASGTVTLAQLANMTAGLLGRDSGTGAPQIRTFAQVMADLSGQNGADFSVNSHKVTNVTDATATTDAATLNNAIVQAKAGAGVLAGPNNCKALTMPRSMNPNANLASLTSGVAYAQLITCFQGDTISNLVWASHTTALSGVNHLWVGLVDQATLTYRAVSTDQTSATWNATSELSVALATPYQIPTTAAYYMVLMVNASQVPTLHGIAGSSSIPVQDAPIYTGTSGSGLTTPPTAGSSTLAALTKSTIGAPWAYAT